MYQFFVQSNCMCLPTPWSPRTGWSSSLLARNASWSWTKSLALTFLATTSYRCQTYGKKQARIQSSWSSCLTNSRRARIVIGSTSSTSWIQFILSTARTSCSMRTSRGWALLGRWCRTTTSRSMRSGMPSLWQSRTFLVSNDSDWQLYRVQRKNGASAQSLK